MNIHYRMPEHEIARQLKLLPSEAILFPILSVVMGSRQRTGRSNPYSKNTRTYLAVYLWNVLESYDVYACD